MHVGETLRSICEALMRLIPWKALSDAARDEDLGIEAIRLAQRLKKLQIFIMMRIHNNQEHTF